MFGCETVFQEASVIIIIQSLASHDSDNDQ